MRVSPFFATATAAAVLLCALAARAEPATADLRKRLQGDIIQVAGREIDPKLMAPLYQRHNWRPLWTAEAGLNARGTRFMDMLRNAEREGLDGRSYNLAAISARLDASKGQPSADLDLLLTDAFQRYAADLRRGRVTPAEVEEDWRLPVAAFDAGRVLHDTMRSEDFSAAVESLPPASPAYAQLRAALAQHRDMARAGGWPTVPVGEVLKAGMEDVRIIALRRRLAATGELAGPTEGMLFDDEVEAALKTFQARHGLAPDGTLGRQTLAALNTPVEARINQIALNMERWRWMPGTFERRHIAVNAADASLALIEDGAPALSMRVVVGDPKHPTPTLRGVLNSLVLNPVWNVPTSIASKEILPKLHGDPGYLLANRIRIVGAFPEGSAEAEGIGIDWTQYPTHMPFQLRQMAGPDNSLGRIKFNLPNSDDIYLHDTPQRQFFAKANRALSHGCVRLENPLELALHLLKGQPEWPQEKLAQGLDDGATKTIRVKRTIPVYLLYWTAWVDDGGAVQFRDDIYGRDKRLRAALAKRKSLDRVAQSMKRML